MDFAKLYIGDEAKIASKEKAISDKESGKAPEAPVVKDDTVAPEPVPGVGGNAKYGYRYTFTVTEYRAKKTLPVLITTKMGFPDSKVEHVT